MEETKTATKDLSIKEGWKNRHLGGMPKEVCRMVIAAKDGEERVWWYPYDEKAWAADWRPSKGFLGVAWRDTSDPMKRIGWNVWEQNNHEFVHYKLVEGGK